MFMSSQFTTLFLVIRGIKTSAASLCKLSVEIEALIVNIRAILDNDERLNAGAIVLAAYATLATPHLTRYYITNQQAANATPYLPGSCKHHEKLTSAPFVHSLRSSLLAGMDSVT